MTGVVYSRFIVMMLFIGWALLYHPRVSSAQVDPWEFEVYPYLTTPRGAIEVEMLNGVVANGHNRPGIGTGGEEFASRGSWYSALEFTYGLTDRIEGSFYLNWTQTSGHGFWYSGSKYRLRGRLFDEGRLPVNLSWYAELEWNKKPQFDDTELEFELRPIIEKDFGLWSIVLNPKFEKPITGPDKNKGFEFGYANGIYYRWKRYLSPGVEFYGGIGRIDDTDPLHDQQHYVFPVVWGELPHGIEYSVGPGIGLTGGSDHLVMKFNLEFERFVGALFEPSSESTWFF